MTITLHPAWSVTYHGLQRGFSLDMLGFIPIFLALEDPRVAIEQIDANYSHGGGWRRMSGVEFRDHGNTVYLQADEETLYPLATTSLRDERLYYYEYSLVAVVRADGTSEVARLD